MKIQIETSNHIGSQLINICKKFCIEFTVERETSCEYVDLGLPSGLKWAKCNVGAKTPTECGKYFRWGEVTDVREIGNDNTYSYLKPFEDAATYHMGRKWRMPTKEEFYELRDNTTSKWVEDYQGFGGRGRLFTSKINGNELFIPTAGYIYSNDVVHDVGSSGHVWTSSLASDDPYGTWGLYLSNVGTGMYNYSPCYGFSVRGVRY